MQESSTNQDDTRLPQPVNESPAETPVESSETTQENMPTVEELLRRAELQAQEHHDAWLRAKAEADNVRKRAQVEIAAAHKFGMESFAKELLPVKDSLEAALAADNNTVENLRAGVELTLRQLVMAFEKFGLKEINPVGEPFDPNRHEAMSMVQAPDTAPNTVVQVLRKGYALHDRVIRPALVTVSAPKAD